MQTTQSAEMHTTSSKNNLVWGKIQVRKNKKPQYCTLISLWVDFVLVWFTLWANCQCPSPHHPPLFSDPIYRWGKERAWSICGSNFPSPGHWLLHVPNCLHCIPASNLLWRMRKLYLTCKFSLQLVLLKHGTRTHVLVEGNECTEAPGMVLPCSPQKVS